MQPLNLIEEECKDYNYQLIFTSQQVNILYINTKNLLICQINSDINLAQFKDSLRQMTAIMQKYKIKKLVLDKRHMVTIHYLSMEWFYVIWLEQMVKLGLHAFYKILPDNELFRFGLKVSREKILHKKPQFYLQNINTYYCNSLKEVFQNI